MMIDKFRSDIEDPIKLLSLPALRNSSLLTTLEEICFHTQTPFSLEE